MASPAAAQFTYEKSLKGKTLVEGLGFEGAVTVFDDTPRLFRRLGRAKTLARFPLWYFYDSGRFKIVIRAEFRDGVHRVKSIKYSDDPQRQFATTTGIRLGDALSKVVTVYGETVPQTTTTKDRIFTYRYRGIAFHVGKTGSVDAISVFRPVPRSGAKAGKQKPPESLASAVIRPDKTKLKGLADVGVMLPVPAGWTSVVPVTEIGGSFAPAGGHVSLNVSVCGPCTTNLATRVAAMEAKLSSNQVPTRLRRMDAGGIRARHATEGHFGFYASPDGSRPIWLLGLGRKGHNVVVVVRVNNTDPLAPSLQRDVVKILSTAALLPPTE